MNIVLCRLTMLGLSGLKLKTVIYSFLQSLRVGLVYTNF